MSDTFVHCTHIDDKFDGSSFSFAGTGSKRGNHALEWTSYFHPGYPASHTTSSVSLELWGSVLLPNNWSVDTLMHAHGSATAAQFDSSPLLLPPTLDAAPTPLYASGNSQPHSGYSASLGALPLISQHDSHTVAMPTPTGHSQCGAGSTDAHTYHYEPSYPSYGFPYDDYMVEYPRAIPSPSIAMPIVPMSLGAGASSHLDPVIALDPTLRQSPCHPTTTFQHLPPSDSTLSLSPSGSFDSESYSSPSPLSMENYSLVVSPSEMSDQDQFQPSITTFVGQLYAFTVPLEAVEFPPISGSGEVSFFQCRWENCGIWIASDKGAVRNHLIRTHNVVLNSKSTDSACCEWVGCSSSLQRNGLVRHFQTHLELKWLCSVCKGAYTRQDSVKFHARKELRCRVAQAISHPSAVAYSARRNEDSTVTLIKILQP